MFSKGPLQSCFYAKARSDVIVRDEGSAAAVRLAGDAVAVAVHVLAIAGLPLVERRPARGADLVAAGVGDGSILRDDRLRGRAGRVAGPMRPFFIEHPRALLGRCGKPLDRPAGR